MEKFIKIETECDEDGNENGVRFTTNGFDEFTVIGMLTFYRDKMEIEFMRKKGIKTVKSKSKTK